MASISAEMVKALRDSTHLPMMECKQALTSCSGDLEAAMSWLRKQHKGMIDDRGERRETSEGRIAICIDESHKVGGMIELRCETHPVAQNELFLGLADSLAKAVVQTSVAKVDLEALRKRPELDAAFASIFGKLRESMRLTSTCRVEGTFLTSYLHHDGKSGVLIALDAVPSSDRIGPDLCMHAIFARPLAIDRAGIPAAEISRVRAEEREIAEAEGKNPQIIGKIIEGKANAFVEENALMDQLHVRSDLYGKKNVRDVLREGGVNAITDYAYMRVGV